jgi:hypothetical protein
LVAITSPRQAEAFTPALTTMDFPAAEMGRLGVELLIRQLDAEGGEADPIHRLLRAELSVRQSSGPAPNYRDVSEFESADKTQATTGRPTTSAGVRG